MIIWNGVKSDRLYCIVERYPAYNTPARKQQAVSVPGRNGDLLLTEPAYHNYRQSYEVYLSGYRNRSRLHAVAHAVAAWLNNPPGYGRLTDDYTPDSYRLAYFEGPVDFENILNEYGRATITFNCKPQRYLFSGDKPVTIAVAGWSVVNPTAFEALPIIAVHGSGAASLQVGSYVCAINSITDGMVIDSDLQNVYKGTANLNADVNIPDFPALAPGQNTISWSGGITSVEITPKWWTL